MHVVLRLSALSALAALLILPLQAQTEAPEPIGETEVVVVTADRTVQPIGQSIASATVITAKQIKEQGAQTVADVMRLVPGVTLRQSGQVGAAASTYIRGSKSNQILVLVDGERVSSPAFIMTDLSKLPVDDVSRIEVIRGPVSSLYGSEAIGGVINIITRRPSDRTGDLALSLGDHGRQERSLSLGSGGEKMSWQLVSSVPTYDGSRANSDYSATNMSAKVIMPSVKGWDLALNARNDHDSLGLPGPASFPSPNDHQWWARTSTGITAGRQLGGGRLEMNLYHNRQQLDEKNPDWFLDSSTTGTTDAGEITYNVETGRHQWVTGVELRNENYKNVSSGVSKPDRSIGNQAFFMQDRLALGAGVDAVIGARFDDHSMAGSRLTPRAGITCALQPGINLRASYSEGFRAPSLVELYYDDTYGKGNPDLRPEKSRQYELGLGVQRGSDNFDIAVFTNNVRDQIGWVVVNPQTWEGTYQNTSRARQQGIELSWSRRFKNSFGLGFSYTYLDAIDRTTGDRLLAVPHNHITLTVTGDVKSWQTALSGRWTDTTLDYGGTQVGSHLVCDLTLQRKGDKPTNPYVTIRNLFNAKYQEVNGYPAERISIEAGMRTGW